MNVSLTPELERFVNEKVEEGLYTSASEVVRDGLRLLTERDQERKVKLEALRHAVAEGLAQVDQGHGVAGQQAFARVRGKRSPRGDR